MTGGHLRTAEPVNCPVCGRLYIPDQFRVSACSGTCIEALREREKLGPQGLSSRPQRGEKNMNAFPAELLKDMHGYYYMIGSTLTISNGAKNNCKTTEEWEAYKQEKLNGMAKILAKMLIKNFSKSMDTCDLDAAERIAIVMHCFSEKKLADWDGQKVIVKFLNEEQQ